ncbi:FKBP-type peptidyl-prolyl cis-trans isomerase [Streptomyces sp. NRRL F-2799]|uniref:FKBP-type peptidyl-prolyl cis-trans isomerase n=1 Tax=Streptomyces sp. NRRL F-2799 TaxID=1463844 RepID=UPI0004C57DEE|nr:FKBP-type peptidyl-prolyl cis-trans isomerase [Streptomyces sp. NRRL F-2799]
MVAPPAAAYGSTGSAQFGVTGKDTVAYAVDILKVVAGAIVPGEQASVPGTLPEVRVNKGDGTATVTVPDRAAPRELVVRNLVDAATLFQSSRADGCPLAVVIGRGNLIAGWDRALIGRRVGSRVLAVIPAKLVRPASPQGPGAR